MSCEDYTRTVPNAADQDSLCWQDQVPQERVEPRVQTGLYEAARSGLIPSDRL